MYLTLLTKRLDDLAAEIRASRVYDAELNLRYALVQTMIHDLLRMK